MEVFVGLDAIRASAEVVPGLPSRASLEDWLAKHDSVDKELEVFDTVELEKLRKLTKGDCHFHRCSRHAFIFGKLLHTETYPRWTLMLLN